MGNLIGIIIAIAIGMWILFNLFRGAEEEPREEGERREGPKRSGSLSNDVDRFLEEINRRRREAMARESGVAPPPVEAPQRRRRPEREPQQQRKRPEQIPSVVPVGRGRGAALPVVELVVDPSVPMAEPVVPLVLPPVAGISRPALSPAVTQLRSMLRDPQSLRVSFMLQEVLGPPRCRRHGP